MDDRGVVVLMDDRFLWSEYQALFPREWQPYCVVTAGNVGQVVKEFWD